MTHASLIETLEQFAAQRGPVAIVPVTQAGQEGVFHAMYDGDLDWHAQANDPAKQADVAIACCMLAYRDAKAQGCEVRA